MNGEPLPVKKSHKDQLDLAIYNDVEFLYDNNIIDYSLLVVVDKENSILRLGIIDYLRLYKFDKNIENKAKQLINYVTKKGAAPTIVHPKEYEKRFKDAYSKSFMEIWFS